ncbi:hypothetical protein QL285_042557 [Trifolium repens]|nr:hypothetical protein QL285_042557 [Trifolium repens]
MSGSIGSKDSLEGKDTRAIFPIWDCGSPLYDSCELVTFSHIIERHMMECPYLGGSKQIITKFSDLGEMMISNGNAKGSSKWNNLSEFFVKILWTLQENWKIATDHLRQYDLNRRRFVSAGRYCGVFQPPPLTSNYRQAILGG